MEQSRNCTINNTEEMTEKQIDVSLIRVDSNEYEEQPKQSSKRIRCLAYGFISSRKTILIIKE